MITKACQRCGKEIVVYSNGTKYCAECGVEVRREKDRASHARRYEKIRKRKKYWAGGNPKTICDNCRNAFAAPHGCSWFRFGEPVEGWTAYEDYPTGVKLVSYCVRECPLFERDRYDENGKRERIPFGFSGEGGANEVRYGQDETVTSTYTAYTRCSGCTELRGC